MDHPFPYTPSSLDSQRLTVVTDRDVGVLPATMPVSLRNAICSRNSLHLPRTGRQAWEREVTRLWPTARVYGDRFGAVALDMSQHQPWRVGTYTIASNHGHVHYPDNLKI